MALEVLGARYKFSQDIDLTAISTTFRLLGNLLSVVVKETLLYVQFLQPYPEIATIKTPPAGLTFYSIAYESWKDPEEEKMGTM